MTVLLLYVTECTRLYFVEFINLTLPLEDAEYQSSSTSVGPVTWQGRVSLLFVINGLQGIIASSEESSDGGLESNNHLQSESPIHKK